MLLVSYGKETQRMRDLSENIRALYVVWEHGNENVGTRTRASEYEVIALSHVGLTGGE